LQSTKLRLLGEQRPLPGKAEVDAQAEEPWRRPALESFAAQHLDDNGTLRLSPATTDITVARKWLAMAGGSLDSVVAKQLDLPYEPGTSRGMQKISGSRILISAAVRRGNHS
jgi:hypothetical protein